ncbi:hypothetical protein [Thalassospira tepidiphila]|uniref:hypothetical protein n=1 Tax=Thalassospira tepidiphila TaxID=393657 RepID=UPI00292572BE|nr:hypothetical protein MACH01_30220 [Thalassospira tepidiphila]
MKPLIISGYYPFCTGEIADLILDQARVPSYDSETQMRGADRMGPSDRDKTTNRGAKWVQ